MSSETKNMKDVSITVRAPNGATEHLIVDLHERADKVTREAVKKFRDAHQLADGDFDLALSRNGGAAEIISPTQRMDELQFDPRVDIFYLINKKPQVDG
jgi:hypothetical protein